MTIPIIGQPEMLAYHCSFLVKCPCGHHFMLSGVIGDSRLCGGTGCKMAYQIGALPVVTQDHKLMQAPCVISPDGKTLIVGVGVGSAP
jgi:hypothetical protein